MLNFAVSNLDMTSFDSFFSSPFFPYIFALVMALPFIVLLRQFVYTYIKMKDKELKMLSVKGNAENKSQAYERMVLFLDRMKPSNLVNRFDRDLAPHEFVFLTEKSVNDEFEYNSSQQLYITKNSWVNIQNAKNALVKLLHDSLNGLNSNADLEELKTVFLMNYVNGDDFIGDTIEGLRREVLLVT